ncbi:MAG TPA: TolC family protein [Bryobacteraceae bacterium]|nr:TolC family protein [Bryobacteraceae bacterium]
MFPTLLTLLAPSVPCPAQPASKPAEPSKPIHITLRDALDRARQYGFQIQSGELAISLAREDRVQARAAMLPSLNALNQFIYTEGNGTPSGVFVANDGVHVYNEQAVVHQELLSPVRRGELRRARALEALAVAKRDVAARGLSATVVQNYYAVVAGARKIANAQTSLHEAQHFLEITQKLQQGGEAALADVIKARLQLQQRQRDLQDFQVALEKSKVALAIFIFPDVTRDFTTEDDLENAGSLQDFQDVQSEATANSPDLRAAQANLLAAQDDVAVARYAYLPSLSLDFFYGIDANQFANRTSYSTPESGRSTLPNYLVPFRQNLGYSGSVTLNIPVWNWGSTKSKIEQARLREEQARLDLGLSQKQFQANLQTFYLEAQAAQAQIDSLRSSLDLSSQSLRLTLSRYQAGEGTVLEVSDAQTTLAVARNAFADGLARYRVALANLQTLTGRF